MKKDKIGLVYKSAREGNIDQLKELSLIDQYALVKLNDKNGWRPIHEAADAENLEAITFLIENAKEKIDKYTDHVNIRTRNGRGGTPKYWVSPYTALFMFPSVLF